MLILATDPSLTFLYSVPWSVASILNETGFRAALNYAARTDLARTHTALPALLPYISVEGGVGGGLTGAFKSQGTGQQLRFDPSSRSPRWIKVMTAAPSFPCDRCNFQGRRSVVVEGMEKVVESMFLAMFVLSPPPPPAPTCYGPMNGFLGDLATDRMLGDKVIFVLLVSWWIYLPATHTSIF